jgi:hypothetical protein
MKAMAMETYEPSMAVTTEADRRLLAMEHRPPNHHRVRLAHRAEVHESLLVKTLVARSNTAPDDHPDGFATMLVIAWLVIQVWGGHGAPTKDAILGIGVPTANSIMVWPPVIGTVSWPPRAAVPEVDLDRELRGIVGWADESPSLAEWRESRKDLRPTEE